MMVHVELSICLINLMKILKRRLSIVNFYFGGLI